MTREQAKGFLERGDYKPLMVVAADTMRRLYEDGNLIEVLPHDIWYRDGVARTIMTAARLGIGWLLLTDAADRKFRSNALMTLERQRRLARQGIDTDPLIEVTRRFCSRLQEYGVSAQLAVPGSPETQSAAVPRNCGSIGVIHIPHGLIRCISVCQRTLDRREMGQDGMWQKETYTDYPTCYSVLDARVTQGFPEDILIKSVRRKSFPLFGKVTEIRWQGNDCGFGIIGPLNADSSLKPPMLKDYDVYIQADPRHQCWSLGPRVFDTLDWPSSILRSGPPPIKRKPTLPWRNW